jgi:osmoprotectant transport system substrate-binding protein
MAAPTTRRRRTASVRRRVREFGGLRVALVVAYEGLILFLLALSLGFDDEAGVWRLGPVGAETIVLALLLFLPLLLPRVENLTLPLLGGQASIQFREVNARLDVQEERVDRLSNETDLILNSLAANLLAPKADQTEADTRETIVLGSQRGLEQRVVSALVKTLLQAKLELDDEQIFVRYAYGGVALNFISLYRAKIDVFPSYTWQGYEMSLGPSLQHSADRLRGLSRDDAVDHLRDLYEESGLAWLEPLGFSSNWELVVLAEGRRTQGIETAEELVPRCGRLVLGCTREFFARDAAYGALERAGNRFREVRLLAESELYEELMEERVDVIVGSSTDPALDSPLVRALEGTTAWFGEYHAVPVVRSAVLRKRPAIASAVDALATAMPEDGKAAREEIRALVRRAERLGGSNDVLELAAKEYLERNGVL